MTYPKVSDEILALPRRERRLTWLGNYRGRTRYSPRWADYRRWDGGKPNLMYGIKPKEDRPRVPLGQRIRGLVAHRLFRRQKR